MFKRCATEMTAQIVENDFEVQDEKELQKAKEEKLK